MNIKSKQKRKQSDHWWRMNRKIWCPWAIDKADKQAQELYEFFNG